MTTLLVPPANRLAQKGVGVFDSGSLVITLDNSASGLVGSYDQIYGALGNGIYPFYIVKETDTAVWATIHGTYNNAAHTVTYYPGYEEDANGSSGSFSDNDSILVYSVFSADLLNQINNSIPPKVVAEDGTSLSLTVAAHNNTILVCRNSSALTLTTPSDGSSFRCWVVRTGAGSVTVHPYSGNLNGATSDVAISARYKKALLFNDAWEYGSATGFFLVE